MTETHQTDTAPPRTHAVDQRAELIAQALAGGRERVGDRVFLQNPKGGLDPIELVRPADQLLDETVRKIMAFAEDESARVARFKANTLNDVADFMAVLLQDYGTKLGGEKGNVTLTSYDGRLKVALQVQERLTFGPELQAAKANVDAYLADLTEDADPVIVKLVQHAFRTDQAGLVNRAELFRLLRLEIADERWQAAMRAIKDSIRVEGTKEHVRFYKRADARARWEAVTIDVADA